MLQNGFISSFRLLCAVFWILFFFDDGSECQGLLAFLFGLVQEFEQSYLRRPL